MTEAPITRGGRFPALPATARRMLSCSFIWLASHRRTRTRATRVNPMSLDVSRSLPEPASLGQCQDYTCSLARALPIGAPPSQTPRQEWSIVWDHRERHRRQRYRREITALPPANGSSSPPNSAIAGACAGRSRSSTAAAETAGPIAPDWRHHPQPPGSRTVARQRVSKARHRSNEAAERGIRRVAITAHGMGPHLAVEAAAAEHAS